MGSTSDLAIYVLIESSCYMGRSGQSRLRWLCFEDPHIIPDRKNSGQAKTRCFEKCSPFALTSLSAAGNGQHVEITLLPPLISQADPHLERHLMYEFDNQQTAVRRNHGSARAK